MSRRPRTELHQAASVDDLATRRGMTIYFSGVPDATPEFNDESTRAAWVTAALIGRD